MTVATEALRKDAQEWMRWSGTLFTASQTASSLTLSAEDMCGLSAAIGLPDLYAEIQQRAAQLTMEGARTFVDVADALNLAARHYDQADERATGRLTPI
ncbi:hypothetical protein [Micromonospora sonneratiae]|uniref:hypothetical protein n=1 Tax=Micromonospora sonneratiae TaxID=1184706 RepID=UPI00366DD9A7